MRYLLKKVTIT